MAVSRRGALKLDEFLPYRLSVTANLVSAAVAQAYAGEKDLRVTHWRLLAALGELEAASQQALCVKTRMDKMTVSRACTELARRKWVQRAAHEDGRAWKLSLTAAGRDAYERIVPRVRAVERAVFGGLSAAERETLEALLLRIDGAALDQLA